MEIDLSLTHQWIEHLGGYPHPLHLCQQMKQWALWRAKGLGRALALKAGTMPPPLCLSGRL